jgi:hypothetical protein
MATGKRNEDGLIGGSLVSEKDHLAIVTKKRTDAVKKAKRMAAEKVINPV